MQINRNMILSAGLHPSTANLLLDRFGLGATGEKVSLTEAAATRGMTRVQVRRIERDALITLRDHLATLDV